MQPCALDHLVVAARSLEEGVAHVRERLGVEVPYGGTHPLMGTHNCLMRLGETAFLEVISVDPQASSPNRPRWYALDSTRMQARLATRPALITWVVRCPDIAACAAASQIDTGPVIEGRRGELVWQITVPTDGSMPEGGLFPTLIQWPEQAGAHGPAARMPDMGCTLDGLILRHRAPEALQAALASIGADMLVTVEDCGDDAPGLLARIATPAGVAELR